MVRLTEGSPPSGALYRSKKDRRGLGSLMEGIALTANLFSRRKHSSSDAVTPSSPRSKKLAWASLPRTSRRRPRRRPSRQSRPFGSVCVYHPTSYTSIFYPVYSQAINSPLHWVLLEGLDAHLFLFETSRLHVTPHSAIHHHITRQ